MQLTSLVLPLTHEESIYVLEDDGGRLISAGTRDVCELLLQLLNKDEANEMSDGIGLLLKKQPVTAD